MTSRVLEVGMGTRPAVLESGEAFSEAGTDYFGIDVRSERVEDIATDFDPHLARGIVADSAGLPFADQSFSHVIMRSVFGEYTSKNPDNVGSDIENTQFGVYEAFRVLQDNGAMIIAEGMTPLQPTEIVGTLLYAGFENITIYPCQDKSNPHWQEVYTRYWGNKNTGAGYGYVMHATRPQTETITFEVPILLKANWAANRKRGRHHPDNKPVWGTSVTQRSVREVEYESKYSQVAIVTKDGVTDLRTHIEEVRKDHTRSLFPFY